MRGILALSTLVCTIALPLAVICAVVTGLMFDVSFYRAGQERYRVELTTGLTAEQLARVDDGIARFFASSESLPQALQQSGAVADVFNQREILHMNDVRGVVQFIIRLGIAAFLLVLATIVVDVSAWGDGGRIALAHGFTYSAILTIVVAIVVGGITYVAFDQLFLTFHELVFHNNYWQLDPRTDHLIQMFPFGFWYDAMVTVALRVAVIIFVIGGCGVLLARTRRRMV